MTTPVRPPTPTLAALIAETAALDTYTSALESALAAAQTPPTPVQPPTPIQPPIVPPVVTQPPTPPVTPPAANGLTTIWHEDFTEYATTPQMIAGFPKGAPHLELSSGPIGNVTLDQVNGANAMALKWSGGGVGPTPTFSPRFNWQSVAGLPGFTSLSVKWRDRYSAGFQLKAEYKAFLVKLGPNTSSGMPQIGVYLETGGVVKMDITDRVHNINTGSPVPGIPGNSPIQTHGMGPGWDGVDHDWEIRAFGLGTTGASFALLLDGVVIIGPLVGAFCPGAVVGGSGQIMPIEPGSNINAEPDTAQTRWIESIEVATG